LGVLAGYRFTHALAVSADGAIVVGEANLDAALSRWRNCCGCSELRLGALLV